MHEPPNPLDPCEAFDLENGDLLFQDLVGDGLSEAIETVTPGFRNAEISHVGMFVKIAGRDMVIEAFPPDVKLTPFAAFAGRALDDAGRPRVFVGRLEAPHRHLIPAAVQKALELRGRTYDKLYLSGEDAYYCSELIVDVFKCANNGEYFFPEQPMSFRDPETGRVLEYWEKYYENFGMPVPEGEAGSNPGELSLSDKIDIVHRYGFLTNWR